MSELGFSDFKRVLGSEGLELQTQDQVHHTADEDASSEGFGLDVEQQGVAYLTDLLVSGSAAATS